MYKVVIDYGNRREYLNCHSKWSADMVCDKYMLKAKINGDIKTKFYVEEIKMDKERAMYLAGRALGELIYGGEGYDPEEMTEWVKNEFDMTDEEFDELGFSRKGEEVFIYEH